MNDFRETHSDIVYNFTKKLVIFTMNLFNKKEQKESSEMENNNNGDEHKKESSNTSKEKEDERTSNEEQEQINVSVELEYQSKDKTEKKDGSEKEWKISTIYNIVRNSKYCIFGQLIRVEQIFY